jgi:hypothetical protein
MAKYGNIRLPTHFFKIPLSLNNNGDTVFSTAIPVRDSVIRLGITGFSGLSLFMEVLESFET